MKNISFNNSIKALLALFLFLSLNNSLKAQCGLASYQYDVTNNLSCDVEVTVTFYNCSFSQFCG